ncbi:hypothetical protein Tco_1448697 [Tanacetum coccineum]
MAQQIILVDQLVPKFQGIGRCNNYNVLHSIPRSLEWKIIGKILLGHPLSYALTATADVPAVYLQQFWKTMIKIPDTMDTIRFKRLVIKVYLTKTSGHDQTKINILQLFHALVIRTNVDYAPLIWWDFMNNVFQKKNDDTLLVSVYSIGNDLFRGMRIPDAFLTSQIRATNDYKEYETVFDGVYILMNQPQPVDSTQGTYRTTPSAHRTPTLTVASPQGKKRKQSTEAQENIAKVKEKLDEEEIERMVEGEEDEESYASKFADSMLNDDVDDSETKIEPGSYKEHPKNVNDDDEEIEKQKKDDEIENKKKDDDKDYDEVATSSMETRNEKMQTPIPTPTRSPRKYLSSDKTISKELTTTVSPTTAITPKDSSTLKCKKTSLSYKMKILPGKFLDNCNKIIPEITFAKTNEMIKEEIPRLVNLAVNKDHEVDPINVPELISKEFVIHGPKMIEELFRKYMQNTTLNLYPTTSSLIAEKSTANLQQ